MVCPWQAWGRTAARACSYESAHFAPHVVECRDEASSNQGTLWQVDGGLPQASGTTRWGLPAINHTGSFLLVSDWNTPVNQSEVFKFLNS